MPTALIIEDTPDNMRLICYIFSKNGIDTIEAETGQKGIDLALAEPRPDFVILDIQLPDMDGSDVLKAIRRSEANGGIPIIAMTSYAMSGDKENLMVAGCTGYIEKPIDPMTVMEEIREILKERHR
ncbi:MAG: response regulator [Proteobacteria bacterium]|nr:response regulator [Pseudomonadota bacterium]MBU1708978.1 response regulator [Pseudomonadota bacterium]